jgi:MFS family permease
MSSFPSSARALFLLCLCCGCWAFGFGLELPLASRWMQDAGRTESFIGCNNAVHFFGVILVGAFAPTLVCRACRGCIAAGLTLSGLSVALFPWAGGAPGWFALRLLAGAGGAAAMIGLETLINLTALPQRRARNFALYACSVGIGFAAGSFTGLHLFGVAPRLSFAIGGGVTLAAAALTPLLPIFPVQRLERTQSQAPIRAPLLTIGGAFGQGFLEAGMLALLPLYLRAVGMSDSLSGTFIGVTLLGVLICQWPIGCLADRFGRERILIGCFLAVAAGLAAAPFADPANALPVCLFVIGVCSGAFYPLGLAMLGEKLPAEALPRANALFVGINCLGSLVSQPVSGYAMTEVGPHAMFWAAEALVLGVVALWAIAKIRGGSANYRTGQWAIGSRPNQSNQQHP